MTKLNSNLKFLREGKAFTLDQLSEKLGISSDELQRIENGLSEPGLDILLKISEVFSVLTDRLLKRDLKAIWEELKPECIKLILLDVDGSMTDGGMYYTANGDQFKKFYSQDGLAIHRLITRYGMQFGFVSSGHTPAILQARADVLGIQRVYTGSRPKTDVVDEWVEEMDISYDNIVYVGDDLNDLPMIRKAGLSACPMNAVDIIKSEADIVLSKEGGKGCVRELLEDILGFDIRE